VKYEQAAHWTTIALTPSSCTAQTAPPDESGARGIVRTDEGYHQVAVDLLGSTASDNEKSVLAWALREQHKAYNPEAQYLVRGEVLYSPENADEILERLSHPDNLPARFSAAMCQAAQSVVSKLRN
jgi:hypothetical protein